MVKNFVLVRKGLVVVAMMAVFFFLMASKNSYSGILVVKGAVNNEVSRSLDDFKKMEPFHINDVPLIKEKTNENDSV